MKDKMVPLLVFARLITQTILNSVPMLIVLNIKYMKDKMVFTTSVPNDMILTHSHSSQMGFEQI